MESSMTTEQLLNMRALSNKRFLHALIFSVWSMSLEASPMPDGIAIEPMEIKVKRNTMVEFRVYNNTDNDYIITQKVVPDKQDINNSKTPFVVNPPVRLLKKRSDVKMGIVYLSQHKAFDQVKKYYLSVSFIPKTRLVPNELNFNVILTQQIEIKLN